MLVVIRADSSSVIGSGHLMRCLTLAEKFRKEDNAEAHFISRDLEGNLNFLVEKKKFSLHTLPRHEYDASLTGYAAWLTVTEETDATETQKVLEQLGFVDMLVVDSYAIGEAWEKKLRPRAKKIFVIDDLADRRHDCDILLDQGCYPNMETRYDGLLPSGCKRLIGPSHMLFREEFYEVKKHLRKRDGRVRNILVFYGGSDPTDETTKALRALLKVKNIASMTVNVVVGGGNMRKKAIEEFCDGYDFFRFHCQVDNMAELMNEADLALGAGGATSWELIFLELPSIVTAIAENQMLPCKEIANLGLIYFLGKYTNVSVKSLRESVGQCLETGTESRIKCLCNIGEHDFPIKSIGSFTNNHD